MMKHIQIKKYAYDPKWEENGIDVASLIAMKEAMNYNRDNVCEHKLRVFHQLVAHAYGHLQNPYYMVVSKIRRGLNLNISESDILRLLSQVNNAKTPKQKSRIIRTTDSAYFDGLNRWSTLEESIREFNDAIDLMHSVSIDDLLIKTCGVDVNQDNVLFFKKYGNSTHTKCIEIIEQVSDSAFLIEGYYLDDWSVCTYRDKKSLTEMEKYNEYLQYLKILMPERYI